MRDLRINALIIEDDEEALALLKMYLKQHGAFSEIDTAGTAEEGLFKLMETNPDIVFLDIQLPGKSGIDVLDVISGKGINSNFVIVSSSRNFALNAIKLDVFNYLLKPVNKIELYNIIDKFRLQIITNPDKKINEFVDTYDDSLKIKISTRHSYTLIDPVDIIFCKTEGSFTELYLNNGQKEMANTSLLKLEEILSKFTFYRISRAIVINTSYLRSINRQDNQCILEANGFKHEVSGSDKLIRALSRLDF